MTKQDRDHGFARYADFWPHYLRQHSKPGTRGMHFAGTALVIATLAVTIGTATWWLFLTLPVIGYGFAWVGHFLIEGNRPATFGHPLWSLFSDFRMFFLWCVGKLQPELDSAGISEHSFQNKTDY